MSARALTGILAWGLVLLGGVIRDWWPFAIGALLLILDALEEPS